MSKAKERPIYLYVFGGLIILLGLLTGVATLFVMLFRSPDRRLEANLCMDHLRNVAKALRMYATDSDDTLPLGDRWMDHIARYVGSATDYNCPAVREGYGYAYHDGIAGKALAEISSPFFTPLAFDSTLTGRSAVGSISTLPTMGRHDRNGRGNVVVNVEGGAEFRPVGVLRKQTPTR